MRLHLVHGRNAGSFLGFMGFLSDPLATILLVSAFVGLHLVARLETSRLGQILMGPRPTASEEPTSPFVALEVPPPVEGVSAPVDPPTTWLGWSGSWVSMATSWMGFGGSEAILSGGSRVETRVENIGPASSIIIALDELQAHVRPYHLLSPASTFDRERLNVRL